jgi:hypothetical protein
MPSETSTRPNSNTYWVVPLKLLAGEYPGDEEPVKARKKITNSSRLAFDTSSILLNVANWCRYGGRRGHGGFFLLLVNGSQAGSRRNQVDGRILISSTRHRWSGHLMHYGNRSNLRLGPALWSLFSCFHGHLDLFYYGDPGIKLIIADKCRECRFVVIKARAG